MVLWFWVSFVATVVALGYTIAAGLRGRRRTHFACATLFVVLLTVTIVLTEELMRAVTFPRAELDFHLKFAIGATVLLLPVIASGVMYARRGGKKWRMWHRIAVVLFVLSVLMATATGVWVFSLST